MILTFFDKLFTIVMRYICIVTLTHNCKLSFMVISRVEKKKYWKFSNIRIFGCWLFWPLRWQAKNRLTCARLQFDSVGSVFFFFCRPVWLCTLVCLPAVATVIAVIHFSYRMTLSDRSCIGRLPPTMYYICHCNSSQTNLGTTHHTTHTHTLAQLDLCVAKHKTNNTTANDIHNQTY